MRWHDAIPEWLPPTILAAVILAIAIAPGSSLDSHEVLVAQTAREMLAHGDWIYPTFAGEPRLEKPPLAYWCAAACYAIFGHADETTARLPAALAAVVGTALVAIFARRAFGKGMGLLAG